MALSPYDPDSLSARDPELIRTLLPAFRALNRGYLRLRVEGAEHLRETRALFVANHNGGIMGPDLSCTLATLWETRGPEAPLYALAHDFAMRQFTPLGRALQRLGALRAAPDNAERVLASGASCLVYPGGDLDAYRHSRQRDEVIFGPRSGFVRAAQRTGAPIVPIVAQGAHRSAYIFSDGERIAARIGLKRWGRLERFPLALALPWGFAPGPWLPYLPLPFPVRLRVLPAVRVAPDERPAEASERIRAEMERHLRAMAAEPEA